MELGFIPDFGHGGGARSPLLWFAGEPQCSTFLGMKVTGMIKAPASEGFRVKALRCPACGLMKLYALKPSAEEARDAAS